MQAEHRGGAFGKLQAAGTDDDSTPSGEGGNEILDAVMGLATRGGNEERIGRGIVLGADVDQGGRVGVPIRRKSCAGAMRFSMGMGASCWVTDGMRHSG